MLSKTIKTCLLKKKAIQIIVIGADKTSVPFNFPSEFLGSAVDESLSTKSSALPNIHHIYLPYFLPKYDSIHFVFIVCILEYCRSILFSKYNTLLPYAEDSG